MERTLVVVRHAKAMPAAESDRLRDLAPSGERDAAAAGRWLSAQALVPDRLVVSPARRTMRTAELAFPGLTASYDDRLYVNTMAALLELLRSTPSEVKVLAMVGHSPGVHQLTELLDAGDAALASDGFPTTGIAVLALSSDWDSIDASCARLRSFHVARS